jgi:hypothetical protein
MELALTKHGHHQVCHRVFNLFGREDSDALRFLVYVKGNAWDVLERSLVMLCFEAEVAFDKDEEASGLASDIGPNPAHVVSQGFELSFGIYLEPK